MVVGLEPDAPEAPDAPDDPDAIVPVCCGYRFRQQKINVNIAATTHMNANTPMVT